MLLGSLKQPVFEIRFLERYDVSVICLISFMAVFLI